jgi:pimeloyl-ACP methyl ester carboxylesterase
MDVEGLDVFYREAGNPEAPKLLLLHGFPSSSHMFRDYASNVALYPAFQDDFRKHRPRLLCVCGKNDPFFLPAGANAFQRDIPEADVRFFDYTEGEIGGHDARIGLSLEVVPPTGSRTEGCPRARWR